MTEALLFGLAFAAFLTACIAVVGVLALDRRLGIIEALLRGRKRK